MRIASDQTTPCFEFFTLMKKRGGISYKDLAKLVLSGRPLADGTTPLSKADDRSWISRYVVNAPIGALQESYFCNFGVSGPRIVSRLKSRRGRSLSSKQILDLVSGEAADGIIQALARNHQDIKLYRNTMFRILAEEGFTEDERAEIAVVLLTAASCLGDVRKAVEQTLAFSASIHGSTMTTPMLTPIDETAVASTEAPMTTLGLMQMSDGYLTGRTFWLDGDAAETEIGSQALSDGAITDVAPDVSAHHARIFRSDDGVWLLEDMGSSNGTFHMSALDHEMRPVEPTKGAKGEAEGNAVQIMPGDEIQFGTRTRFVVVEGLPTS